MKDTLQHITNKAMSLSQEIDLVQKVDAFYNSAWNKLIIFGSIAFAIVGILVPVVIQWYQRRTMKLSEELMKKEISDSIARIKKEIIKDVTVKVEQKFEQYERQIKEANESANAKIFFAQGKFNLEKGFFPVALNEFISASYSCIECSDYQTLQKLLQTISNECLPYLSIEEINDLKVAEVTDLGSFLTDVSNADDKSIFQEVIGEIKVKMTKIPKTIKDKPSEKVKKQEE